MKGPKGFQEGFMVFEEFGFLQYCYGDYYEAMPNRPKL